MLSLCALMKTLSIFKQGEHTEIMYWADTKNNHKWQLRCDICTTKVHSQENIN